MEAGSQEFLVFSLGDEEYAIDILKVQEIRGYENVTRIANAPDFIKGVANLRGVIVPIVDLRIKFRLERADYDDQTVVIVVNIADRVVGIVVDRVSDVMTLTAEQRKPAPDQILRALAELKLPADTHCWYVGDSTTDVVAAKRAGVTAVFYNGAGWDQAWIDKIFPDSPRHPHKPDAVVNDFRQLTEMVWSFWAQRPLSGLDPAG